VIPLRARDQAQTSVLAMCEVVRAGEIEPLTFSMRSTGQAADEGDQGSAVRRVGFARKR
jgi:hypothetical protein